MTAQKDPINVLVVDDEEIVREALSDFLRKLDYAVTLATDADGAFAAIREKEIDIALLDIRLPGMDGLAILKKIQSLNPEISVIIISGHGNMDLAIQALRLGAGDFLKKPVKLDELTAALEKIERLRTLTNERQRLRGALGAIQTDNRENSITDFFVGESPAAAAVRDQIALAARSDCRSVVVTGETGTGKEVVARALHAASRGTSAPFIAVNCPAIPEHLVESELFGHMKGAFTGADETRMGAFELAHGGTLFLDEISDLAPSAQAKLLRVLETRTVRRIGSDRQHYVDLLVVAASNRDLSTLVGDGKFRSDLYFRLNVFHIDIAPLRQRREDIPILAEFFLKTGAAFGRPLKRLAPDAVDLLVDYGFPGNARELRNIMERASMLAEDDLIARRHIVIRQHATAHARPAPSRVIDPEAKETLETLDECNWNRRKAARKLGITYEALRWRIKKFNLAD